MWRNWSHVRNIEAPSSHSSYDEWHSIEYPWFCASFGDKNNIPQFRQSHWQTFTKTWVHKEGKGSRQLPWVLFLFPYFPSVLLPSFHLLPFSISFHFPLLLFPRSLFSSIQSLCTGALWRNWFRIQHSWFSGLCFSPYIALEMCWVEGTPNCYRNTV